MIALSRTASDLESLKAEVSLYIAIILQERPTKKCTSSYALLILRYWWGGFIHAQMTRGCKIINKIPPPPIAIFREIKLSPPPPPPPIFHLILHPLFFIDSVLA